MANDSNHPQPPQPPPMRRSVHLTRLQRVGLPVLVLLPLLGLFGVFGETEGSTEASEDLLRVEVEHTVRTRRGLPAAVTVEVSNERQAALTGVTVALDRAYLDGFDDVSITPSANTIDEQEYLVEIGEVPAGESRSVSITMAASRLWNRSGTVSVNVAGDEAVTVELATLVFP